MTGLVTANTALLIGKFSFNMAKIHRYCFRFHIQLTTIMTNIGEGVIPSRAKIRLGRLRHINVSHTFATFNIFFLIWDISSLIRFLLNEYYIWTLVLMG